MQMNMELSAESINRALVQKLGFKKRKTTETKEYLSVCFSRFFS